MRTSLRTFATVAFMVFGFNLVVLEAQQGKSNVPRDRLDVLPSALDHQYWWELCFKARRNLYPCG
jgi:hypothetical protein